MKSGLRYRFSLGLLLIGCCLAFLFQAPQQPGLSFGQQMGAPAQLLLESGLSQSSAGEVSIVLWLPKAGKLPALTERLPAGDWDWQKVYKQADEGEAILTIAGKRTVTKDDEPAVRALYRELENMMKEAGGAVYLEERVAEIIDPAAYFARYNISPKQWAEADGLFSLAGYGKGTAKGVMAGPDMINTQIVTRTGYSTILGETKQTVLAIPALLQEF